MYSEIKDGDCFLKMQNFIDAGSLWKLPLLIKKIFSSTDMPSPLGGCKKKVRCKWNSGVNWMKYDYNEKVFALATRNTLLEISKPTVKTKIWYIFLIGSDVSFLVRVLNSECQTLAKF